MIREAIQKIVDGKSLTENEASLAMREIMSGSATPSQMSAFLVSLRMKGESVDEIVALTKTMRDFSTKINPSRDGRLLDIVGTGGDAIKTINLSTIASLVVATAGVTVAKHGNRAASGKCGSADVLERLGYRLDASPKDVESAIENIGIGFMFAPVFHPAMKNVIGTRREIGIRTIFNLLGPLTNPAGADALVVGVPNLDLTSKIGSVLKSLGCKNALIVHGLNGLDEISTFGETHISHLHDGILDSDVISPTDLGLNSSSPHSIVGEGVDENATALFEILSNSLPIDDARVEATLANASAGLLVVERVTNLKDGIEMARQTLSSGKCIEKLKDLIKSVGGDVSKIEEFETGE